MGGPRAAALQWCVRILLALPRSPCGQPGQNNEQKCLGDSEGANAGSPVAPCQSAMSIASLRCWIGWVDQIRSDQIGPELARQAS